MPKAPLHSSFRRWSVHLCRLALAKVSKSPLRKPLGRLTDEQIDEALGKKNAKRTDLFKPSLGLGNAPHRHRISSMVATHGLSPELLVENHWEELKRADHYCAFCQQTKRCERWLQWGRTNDAPDMFCPNASMFKSLKKRLLELRDSDHAKL